MHGRFEVKPYSFRMDGAAAASPAQVSMGNVSPGGFQAMGENPPIPMRTRPPSQVPKMFREVTSPYPQCSTFYGRYGAVNYLLEGPTTGELVICFHGLNASRTMFKSIAQALARAGFQVLTFDMYGHGLSNAPKVSMWPCRKCKGFPCGSRRGRYDLDFFVEQTHELLQSLDLADMPCNVVGFSLGGSVAVAYAQRYPDRVMRLAAMSPSGCFDKITKKYYLLTSLWCILIPLANHILCACCYRKDRWARQMKGEDPEVIQSMWTRMVWSLFIKKGVASASLAVMYRVPWFGLEPFFADVGKHPRPVLLVWGEEDTLNPVKTTAQKVKNLFPNSYLLVVKKAQHIVLADQPQHVFNALYDFFKMPQDANMNSVDIRRGELSRLSYDVNANMARSLEQQIERLGNMPAPGLLGKQAV